MTGIEICIPFIAAILGVAYPVLLQVISNLGDKYDSVILVSVFKKEIEYRLFKLILYVTLVVLLLYASLSITRYFDPNLYVSQVEILIIIFTTILIFCFFFLVRKILIYYNRKDLTVFFIEYIKQYDIVDNAHKIYFNALSELFYWAIRNQDEQIVKTLSNYFYDCFKKYREKNEYIQNGYPEIYYDLNYLSTIELLRLKENKLVFLEYRIPGGIWLLGEFAKNTIHDKTFTYLWRILFKTVVKKRDDIVIYYWQNAFQYFSYSLKPIRIAYSVDYKTKINEVEVEKREKQREKFLEFNFAICALLLQQNRYDCLRRILNFTQSQPPNFVLFPNSMKEIFELFFKYADTFSTDNSLISYKYNFPDTEGVDSDNIVLYWFKKYFAILFIRQYTLISYFTYQNHVSVPSIPSEQGEMKNWLSKIDNFKRFVLDIQKDNDLMKGLKFDFITDEWCRTNNKETPDEIFANTKQLIVAGIEQKGISQEPDSGKIEQFYESTDKIISNTLDKYRNLRNESDIEVESDSWFLNGIQTIVDKESFSENQGFTHLNFDSFLAESYSQEINSFLSQQFYLKANKNYLLSQEDLFKGVDQLEIKNSKEYVIIAFDINLSSFSKVKGLDIENKKYNEFDIIEISASFELLHQSLMIIAKSDLPHIKSTSIDSEIDTKYQLKLINSDLNLFSTVIDLNKREDLHKELNNEQYSDLRKFVLLRIELPIEIKWKKKIDAVIFKLHWIYEEKGIPNQLKDIESITNK